jgi:hypothetical protein
MVENLGFHRYVLGSGGESANNKQANNVSASNDIHRSIDGIME